MNGVVHSEFNEVDFQSNESESGSSWVAGLVFILLLALVALFVVDKLYHPGRFPIEQVEVHGQFRHVDGAEVKKAVEGSLDGNYFSASLESIEQHIRQMPWVFDASVRRQWPSTLVVDVEEVQPVATWGDTQWLNASGDLVKREPWDASLPVLHGPDSMQQTVWQTFQNWHGMFAAHGLSLDRLKFDQRELWYLTLSLTALALDRTVAEVLQPGNDLPEANTMARAEVTMIVDNSDATARIKRLIKALNSQLIAEFPAMKSIDLRYPNGFAINWVTQHPDPNKLTESQ